MTTLCGLTPRILWVCGDLNQRLGFSVEADALHDQACQSALDEGMAAFSPDEMPWLLAEGLDVSGEIYLPRRGAPKLLEGFPELETAFAYGFTRQAWGWRDRQNSHESPFRDEVYLDEEEGFLPGMYTVKPFKW